MNPEIKALAEKLIPILYTLLGAVIGIAGTIIVTIINKRSEEKRQLRELAFKAGIENWKEACALARQKGGAIYPLDMFIINMKLLADKLVEHKFEKESIREMLKSVGDVNKEMYDFFSEESQRKEPQKRL